MFLSALLSAAAGDEPVHPAIERLIAELQARQDRFHSGIIEWDQEHVYKRGTYLGASSQPLAADRAFHQEYHFAFSGEAARLERSGDHWDLDTHSMQDERFVNTYNAGSRKRMFAGEKFGAHPSGGHSQSDSLQEGAWDYHVDACVLAFRPLSDALDGVAPLNWQPVGTLRGPSGGELLVFEESVTASGSFRYWVDPQHEHLITRRELLQNGQVWIRLDIDYEQHPEWGAVPRGWTVTRFDRGSSPRVAETIRSSITRLTLNTPIDESHFDIEFPPGTVLSDYRYDTQMLVRADGSLRPIDPAERRAGVSYAEMMTEDSPQMIAERSRRWMLSAAALAVAVIIAGALWWRRRA